MDGTPPPRSTRSKRLGWNRNRVNIGNGKANKAEPLIQAFVGQGGPPIPNGYYGWMPDNPQGVGPLSNSIATYPLNVGGIPVLFSPPGGDGSASAGYGNNSTDEGIESPIVKSYQLQRLSDDSSMYYVITGDLLFCLKSPASLNPGANDSNIGNMIVGGNLGTINELLRVNFKPSKQILEKDILQAVRIRMRLSNEQVMEIVANKWPCEKTVFVSERDMFSDKHYEDILIPQQIAKCDIDKRKDIYDYENEGAHFNIAQENKWNAQSQRLRDLMEDQGDDDEVLNNHTENLEDVENLHRIAWTQTHNAINGSGGARYLFLQSLLDSVRFLGGVNSSSNDEGTPQKPGGSFMHGKGAAILNVVVAKRFISTTNIWSGTLAVTDFLYLLVKRICYTDDVEERKKPENWGRRKRRFSIQKTGFRTLKLYTIRKPIKFYTRNNVHGEISGFRFLKCG